MEVNQVSSRLSENVSYMKEKLGIGKSFDVIYLDVHYAGKDMALFMIDGFVKDDILHYLMKLLSELPDGALDEQPLNKLLRTHLPYVELDETDNFERVIDGVLAGPTALFVDGMAKAILIDARTYPVRGPQEPDMERVVRGHVMGTWKLLYLTQH
ncbi:hypothetical protein LR68_00116 [Anoxybacillus sp. BCO1]|nr:hypothetical protein LR68_00116 [Anoxybacillus sp. BCO1]